MSVKLTDGDFSAIGAAFVSQFSQESKGALRRDEYLSALQMQSLQARRYLEICKIVLRSSTAAEMEGPKDPQPDPDAFTCPECEGHWFLTSDNSRCRTVYCRDQNNQGCRWIGSYAEHVHRRLGGD